MSIKVLSLIWDFSQAKGAELTAMLALSDLADDDGGNIYMPIPDISKKCRVDSKEMQRIICKLEESGELSVHHSTRAEGEIEYRINVALLRQIGNNKSGRKQ